MNAPNRARRGRRKTEDSAQHHRDWLNLVEVSGPFLSVPVLREQWPALDALEDRRSLRAAHATWIAQPDGERRAWIRYVLGDLLGWARGDDRALHWGYESDVDALAMEVAEHDTRVVPDFALVRPGEDAKPDSTELLGLICEAPPTARVQGDTWSATPVDRLARLCRHHEVELGLATDGRWWTLIWAPRAKVTTTATFDAAAWAEKAEEPVVRAFLSLLRRERFFAVPDDEKLGKLLRDSENSQEDITEALGVQVRQAVELLVAAIGRAHVGGDGTPLEEVDAHEVYRGAVSVMMRIVFALFAEERGLLPADNDLYATSYSVGRLGALLDQQARDGSEDDLEYSSEQWNRLLALFDAVYRGVEHPRLTMHAHDGSLFDPNRFPWLPTTIDDRTVLHMLAAVQHVEIGTGRNRELRTLSFRELDVEQIGYVYEGLLSYDGYRADDVVLGLIGKAGVEKEVELRELESLATASPDIPALAAKLAEEYKDHKIGSPKAMERALKPLSGTSLEEARRKLLAACGGDAALADRLLPFGGIIRTDLRELPVVILPGQLYVTDSPLRRNTGTHYTPRELAEEVVEGALEPLVYEPGPLQTADKSTWKLKSSNEILVLKVADIAMGSAAFLVAAARYLGDRLLEAWEREDDERVRGRTAREPVADADVDPVVVQARRTIIEHCLYGVDINEMAVEMAKLSLWLVSMDATRPFSFLDDRLVAGDSLLGITSLDQLEYMHMDPKKGREIHERLDPKLLANVRTVVGDVAADRERLAEIDGATLDGLKRKQEILNESRQKTERASRFADLAVGAAHAHAKRGVTGLRDGSVAAADYARRYDYARQEVRDKTQQWLEIDLPEGMFDRTPLHWPLVFPEVFEPEKNGFDAVVGNPPFVKAAAISSTSGSAYRDYLVENVASGTRGIADLVAYFSLRSHSIINQRGQTGIIATNSLAQGYTREVGLDSITANGFVIRSAIKSEKWPGNASVEFCAVWTTARQPSSKSTKFLDRAPTSGITSSLNPISRATGNPNKLAANAEIAFVGCNLNGLGFIVDPKWAEDLIEKDEKYSSVLHRYINGDELNDSPSLLPKRWVISFHGFKDGTYTGFTEKEARDFPACYQHVQRHVKPERETRTDPRLRSQWWQFKRFTPGLHLATSGLENVIVLAQTSSTLAPAIVHRRQIFDQKIIVFASGSSALFALLSSSFHYWWTIRNGATMKSDISYTPSKVFQTFPLPGYSGKLRSLGMELDELRRDVMLSRNAGLTKTYNLVFDKNCQEKDIEELRRIHRNIDAATIRAYNWEDRIEQVGGLDHGFHPVGRQTRYTIGPAAQREILDSLLELNHERYAEEVSQGLHDKKKKKSTDQTLF